MVRVRVLSLMLAVTAVAVAACGGSGSGSGSGRASASASPGLTLGQEFPAIKAAVRSAKSVSFYGVVLQNGKRVSLDMILTRSGSLSGWANEGGGRLIILVTDRKAYIKVNKPFLRQARVPLAACATVCGKYLELPASSARSLTAGLTMTAMVDESFGTPPTPAQARARLVAAQYRGQPAWFGRYGSYTMDIARAGKPYVLAMTAQHGQVVQLSGWNTASVPGPPPASQLVTSAQL